MISYLAAITSPGTRPANPRAAAALLNGELKGEETRAATSVACSFRPARFVTESNPNEVLQLSHKAAPSGFEVLHSGQISTKVSLSRLKEAVEKHWWRTNFQFPRLFLLQEFYQIEIRKGINPHRGA
jgi:hypothetical protein